MKYYKIFAYSYCTEITVLTTLASRPTQVAYRLSALGVLAYSLINVNMASAQQHYTYNQQDNSFHKKPGSLDTIWQTVVLMLNSQTTFI